MNKKIITAATEWVPTVKNQIRRAPSVLAGTNQNPLLGRLYDITVFKHVPE
jgi:hypothetical protein